MRAWLNKLLPEYRGVDPTELPEVGPIRRRVLKWLGLSVAGVATGTAAVPVIASIFSPVLRPLPDAWVDLGALDQFPMGRTVLVSFRHPYARPWDGASGKAGAYVRREMQEITVFSYHCAHLGCPVTWFPTSGLFMCPCHGGVYNAQGEMVGGPPPRGLFRYAYKVENGHLHIRAGHVPLLHDPLSPAGAAEDSAPPG